MALEGGAELMMRWDEADLSAQVCELPVALRPLAAAVAAERLMPLYSELRGEDAAFELMHTTLAKVWAGLEHVPEQLRDLEAALPDEEHEDDEREVLVAQCTLLAVLYAARAATTHDAQAVVHALRQNLDVVDYLVQRKAPGHTYWDTFGDPDLRPLLDRILATIQVAEQAPAALLRQRAKAEGEELLRLYKAG